MSQNIMSLDRVDEIMREIFKQLKAMGGSGNGTDVLSAVASKVNLSPYELEKTKTGSVRWDTHLRFYTSDCKRAGFRIVTATDRCLDGQPQRMQDQQRFADLAGGFALFQIDDIPQAGAASHC